MNKEKWIDEVMASTTGMQRASPSSGLFERVVAAGDRPTIVKMPVPIARWAAAAVLLIALNIGSIMYYIGHNSRASNVGATNPLYAEMHLESTYNY